MHTAYVELLCAAILHLKENSGIRSQDELSVNEQRARSLPISVLQYAVVNE